MGEVEGIIKGIHHVTLVTSNHEVNSRFYTQIMGLRKVKQTVNQDDIFHRHIFYGDHYGSPGSIITFFEWPHIPKGNIGVGIVHHLCYRASDVNAVYKWANWLFRNRVKVVGPLFRERNVAIYFKDPDGVIIEILASLDDDADESYYSDYKIDDFYAKEITDDMKLKRFDHVTGVCSDLDLSIKFMTKFLGLNNIYVKRNSDDPDSMVIGLGRNHPFFNYLVYPNGNYGSIGIGVTHHVAFSVADEYGQRVLRKRLLSAGFKVTDVIDRFWFKSVYFSDPDGTIMEIATLEPGFTKDEDIGSLGSKLILPPWLEKIRGEIESRLKELDRINKAVWPPSYEPPLNPPERL